MGWIPTVLLSMFLQAPSQNFPRRIPAPAPRRFSTTHACSTAPTIGGIGAKRLLDNDRATVWKYSYGLGMDGPRHRHDRDTIVVWIQRGAPHAVFVPAGTIHSEEQTGVMSEATIFELK